MQSKGFLVKNWQGEKNVLARYAELLSTVYGEITDPEHLYWKHHNSPLGKSLITYAESVDGNMVAARAFWPMYSQGAPVFQPCDTVTHPDFQRRGLFSKLTLACLETLPDNSAIINFPNHNSFPGYLKLGWKLLEENLKVFGYRLPLGLKKIGDLKTALEGKLNSSQIDYLVWRFSSQSGKSYQFWLSDSHLVVSDGVQSGAINLTLKHKPFDTAPGKARGYVLPSEYSFIQGLLKGSVALKCQSRTAFFLKSNAQFETIAKCVNNTQINLLMDTF